eukprot:PITA_29343
MNPALKDILKEELQKLLDAGFIYPIFDNEWVSPLVLVPKKKGKWRTRVDYWELKKATKKDHFPLPFIDQVLDGLAGNFFSPSWMGSAVEIYMDDFTPYGFEFQEALSNLGKVLDKCIEMNLSLSSENCEFFMTEGTMLGHAISQQGLQVDPNKITIIQRVPPPQKQFNLTIIDKPSKENVVADFLSRVNLLAGEEGMVDDQMPDEQLFSISILSPWFADIANYLVSAQFPPHLSSKEKSKIVRKRTPFNWIRGNIFKLGLDQILRRCAREEEVFDILLTCHDGPCGGHFAAKRTAFKILQASYYWPTLHQDVRRYTSQCDRFQRMGNLLQRMRCPCNLK